MYRHNNELNNNDNQLTYFLVLLPPHDPIETHLLTALGNNLANVVGACYIVALVEVLGDAKLFCGSLNSTWRPLL